MLKHCPFCGDDHVQAQASSRALRRAHVHCGSCGVRVIGGEPGDIDPTLAWNRRTYTQADEEGVAAQRGARAPQMNRIGQLEADLAAYKAECERCAGVARDAMRQQAKLRAQVSARIARAKARLLCGTVEIIEKL